MGKHTRSPRSLGSIDRSVKKASQSKRWRSPLKWQRGGRPRRKSEVGLAIIGVLGFIFVIWMVVTFS